MFVEAGVGHHRPHFHNVNAENAGRFGQNVPGLPLDQLTKLTVLNLGDPVDGTRTNIGISNPSDETAHVSVNTVSGTIHVPPRSVVQINDVLAKAAGAASRIFGCSTRNTESLDCSPACARWNAGVLAG